MNKDVFSERLTAIRMERGDYQRDLAGALGMSQTAVSHYEKGDREPTLENLIKISHRYNVSLDWLLGRVDTRVNDLFYELTDEQKRLVEDYIRYLQSKEYSP